MKNLKTFRGLGEEELKKLEISKFASLIKSRERRKLLRGFTESERKLLKDIDKAISGKNKKPIKTHCRDMVIIPKMLGLTIYVHNGKEFVPVNITIEKLGHRLGEFAPSRKRVKHSAPGVGATRSSAFISVK